MYLNTRPINKNEAGVVPIIITIFIMIILGLITIGFAQLMRREQRHVLDRQLSTQAFYAAETGVNDAVKALAKGYALNKTSCAPDAPGAAAGDPFIAGKNKLDAATGIVQYTCLIIDPAPNTLEYGSVGTDHSTGVLVQSQGSTAISSIEVSWQGQNSDTTDTFVNRTPRDFPPLTTKDPDPACTSTTCWPSQTGVLRMSLTPMNAFDRDNLIKNTYTAMLYPFPGAGPGTTTYASGQADPAQGQIVDGGCAAVISSGAKQFRYCNAIIDGLSQKSYFLRLKSIYHASTVTITAYGGGPPASQLRLVGAQALVDATGKANDVLRRIQVRVRTGQDFDFPEAPLDSVQSLCKRFSVWPPAGYQADPIDPSCDITQ